MSFRAIELTPQMSYNSMVQSINENFANIENVAKIYKDAGDYTFPETSVSSGTSINQTHTVAHDLGVKPRYDIFVTNEGRVAGGGGIVPPFPSTKVVTPVFWGMFSATEDFAMNYYIGADEENVYITRRITNISASSATAPPDKVTYYIHRSIIE